MASPRTLGSLPTAGASSSMGFQGRSMKSIAVTTVPIPATRGRAIRMRIAANGISFEVVVENRFSSGYRMRVYMRNVTDNGPERLVLDTNGTIGSGNGNWILSPNLTSNEITAT